MPQRKDARLTPRDRAEQAREKKQSQQKQWTPGLAKVSPQGTAKKRKQLKQVRQRD